MDPIVIAIYAAIVVSGLLGVYLERRQAKCAIFHRRAVPAAFVGQVDPSEHEKAADYTVARSQLATAETIWDMLIAILWLSLWLFPLYSFVARHIDAGVNRSVAFVLCFSLIDQILRLPLSLLRTFGLEAKFGFNRTTPAMYAADLAKGALIYAIVAVPMLYGLFWLLGALPVYWWLLAWLGFMAVMITAVVIYPAFIAPLFNDFTPMTDEPMKSRMEAVLAKCGFESDGLFVMDASKRSSHGNAYFSGFGKAKRIVFFDTLLKQHTIEEIESVLAHELGHFKFGHIRQRILLVALFALLGFLALHWALGAQGLAHRFDLPNDPGLVLVIVLVAGEPILHLLSPFTNMLWRRAEFQADDFAKSMVGKDPMIRALTRLSRENLSTLTPDRLYALFYYSHPPVPLRIEKLNRPSA
jgi:STE24 endopeptidase